MGSHMIEDVSFGRSKITLIMMHQRNQCIVPVQKGQAVSTRCRLWWIIVTTLLFFIIIYLFCHTTNIIKTVKEKIERMDLTMARRPKGNYEAYIN